MILVCPLAKPYNPFPFHKGLQDVKMTALLLSWPLTTGYGTKWPRWESLHGDKHPGELWLVAQWQMCAIIGAGCNTGCNLQSGNRGDYEVCLRESVCVWRTRSRLQGHSRYVLFPPFSLFFLPAHTWLDALSTTLHHYSLEEWQYYNIISSVIPPVVTANFVQVTKVSSLLHL